MSNEHKIWRSFKSDFAGLPSETPNDLTDETCAAVATYDDNELAAIAKSGFNAIWVHGIINNLVRVEPFPELGKNHLRHQAALRELIGRAARHGVKVFIYMQPPRAVLSSDREFWERHPDVAGQEECATDFSDHGAQVKLRALCTSTKPVQTWLKAAFHQLAEALPGLGGVILITSSELPAHCYSHRQKDDPRYLIQCPNCRGRTPADIVVEIVGLVRDGVREVSSQIEVIAWNWSWTMWGIPPPCHEIVDRLPPDVVLMADFERGGHKDLWKRPHTFINEYCLSYAGPSELCLGVFAAARQRGMRTMSKLQLGTTHELASVVSLPLLGNIFKKARYHKHADSSGFMGCWNFGNQLSANTAAFNYFLRPDCPDDEDEALRGFGAAYFPGCDAGLLVESWGIFDASMFFYPFCIPFIYNGPMNYTLAYHEMYVPGKLTNLPAGPSHLIVPRGDDLSSAFASVEEDAFPLDEIIVRLERLAAAWAEGVERLTAALAGCPGANARDEVGNAAICGAVWRSSANTFKIFRLRRGWAESLRDEFMAVAMDELEVLRGVLPHVARDPRQGYHAEAHGHMFDASSVRKKIAALEQLTSR